MSIGFVRTLTAACLVLANGSVSMAHADRHAAQEAEVEPVSYDEDRTVELTLIHMGDVHGHLISRPHLVGDDSNGMQGGLDRMYSKVEEIRGRSETSLLINTGDTIQGSAEALYTSGQTIVDVVNEFDIDYFAPGNWEYVYGTERFKDLFAGRNPTAPWEALAANLYYSDQPGRRVLEPYALTEIDGVKIGILGFTTERGPKVIGSEVVDGFTFSPGDREMAKFVPLLRPQVDVLIMVSELGLANNIRLTDKYPGVDVVLSSDMHEETPDPVVTKSGTLIIEEGQDGTRLGELRLSIVDGAIVRTNFKMHVIDSDIKPHQGIAEKIAEVRGPFISGSFVPQLNPINGTTLTMPIDTIIGHADIDLHRANVATADMPAVIEGSSHDFLADVFREMTQADIGIIRGFRFGTHIAVGPITLEDIYHYLAIGPFIARGDVTGLQIKNIIEATADGSLNPDSAKWTGGWLFGWSGLRYDLNPYANIGSRASNIVIHDSGTDTWNPLDLTATYSLSGYNYDSEPSRINKIPAENVVQYTDAGGNAMDGTQVVVDYLKTNRANPSLNRIHLLESLPDPKFGNPEIQPLEGASR